VEEMQYKTPRVAPRQLVLTGIATCYRQVFGLTGIEVT
jgi:hypothetical protein